MARRRVRVGGRGAQGGIASLALVAVFLCLLVAVAAYRIGATRGNTAPAPPALVSPATTPITVQPGEAPAGMVAARVVRVVDGDTIYVEIEGREYPLRYIGINTPETKAPDRPVEPYGPEASAANERLVAGKTVYLEKDVSETDRYGRLLRYVWLDGVMVNEQLVREGFAQASTYPPDVKYADRFLEVEREAREAGRGLWSLVTPEATVAVTAAPAALCPQGCLTPPPECTVKGNISSDGRKLYHVPGMAAYERTKIEPGQGERWFCTPAEAEAAGWQAAGN